MLITVFPRKPAGSMGMKAPGDPSGHLLAFRGMMTAAGDDEPVNETASDPRARSRLSSTDSVTWRAAILTAVAGLSAGVIGGVTGILGTLVAGHSEADRAHDEFLRTQRQAAYGKFIADAEQLDPLLGDCAVGALTSQVDAGFLVTEESKLKPNVLALVDDEVSVELIGSEAAGTAASRVALNGQTYLRACMTVADLNVRNQGEPQPFPGGSSSSPASCPSSDAYIASADGPASLAKLSHDSTCALQQLRAANDPLIRQFVNAARRDVQG